MMHLFHCEGIQWRNLKRPLVAPEVIDSGRQSFVTPVREIFLDKPGIARENAIHPVTMPAKKESINMSEAERDIVESTHLRELLQKVSLATGGRPTNCSAKFGRRPA